jgi:hypothetical protein
MSEFAAVLEPAEAPSPVRRDELGYRLRQQSLLGEFGRTAMPTRDLRELLQRATELCAAGLRAAFWSTIIFGAVRTSAMSNLQTS